MHAFFASIHCPYCGEAQEIAVDVSAGDQDYIEDCQVCCRPIRLRLRVDVDGEAGLDAFSADDTP